MGSARRAGGRARERLVEEQQRLRRMEMQANAGRQSGADAGELFGRTADPLHQILKQLFDLKD